MRLPITLPTPGEPPASRLHGRGLALARGIRVTLALVLLANFIASVPLYDQALRTTCPPSEQAVCLTFQ